jgi:predicted nucleic acid-binding protein
VKNKRLLDSYALLAYLKQEKNYEPVKVLLSSADKMHIIMNELNVGEVYYIIARERGLEHADYFLQLVLPNLPIKIITNYFSNIIEASRIKAKCAISYADCFAVATAQREKAVIVTGDPEFKKVIGEVDVEWI